MDRFMNKDRFTYQQESQKFTEDLRKFHESRGTPFYKIPLINGKQIDLYLLYTTVTNFGGWSKVTLNEDWDEIHHFFNIPKSCANASHALKEIYIRYLHLYERIHLHGADLENPEGLDEEESRMMKRKRANTPVSTIPMTYNYRQHDIPESLREHFGLSTDLTRPSDYHKLEKSLMSGLANEVDFAINVVTLLSNEGKHIIHLSRAPRILDLLMAQAGIFTEGPSGYKGLYETEWRPKLKRNFIKFWFDTVEDREVKELISPCPEYFEKDKKCELGEYSGKGFLNLDRDLGISDVEGQRVLQIAVILRNLSFEKDNSVVLASHMTAFRFLMLCAHNKYSSLKQIGLDTLGNIAMRITLDPIDFLSTQLIVRTITRCLGSPDKYEVVRGMEILSRLCQVEANEDILTANLEQKAYNDLTSILTVQDIQLIVHALEALYQLSELGEEACNGIADAKHCVDTLIGLVTIEAGSYGPAALQGIKVVEHHVFAPLSPQPMSQQQHHAPQGTSMHGGMPGPVPPHVQRAGTSQPQQFPSQPGHRPTAPDPQMFACNWLKLNYEMQHGKLSNRADIYASFLQDCTKQGQSAVLSGEHFFTCVKMLFPQIEVVTMDHQGSGHSETVFKGLCRRGVPASYSVPTASQPQMPTPGGQQQSPHQFPPPAGSTPQQQSPKPRSVLQQQLMAPPQNTLAFQHRLQQQISPGKAAMVGSPLAVSTPPRPPQTPTPPSPQSSQSNLIKTLLANKLTQNIQKIQGGGDQSGNPTPGHVSNVQSKDGGHILPELAAQPNAPYGVPASGFLDSLERALEMPNKDRSRNVSRSKKSPGTSPSRSASPRSARPGSPRGNSPRRPGSPRSPRSFQLEVCAQVERAQDVVLHHEVVEEAKIERVENICNTRLAPPTQSSMPVNTNTIPETVAVNVPPQAVPVNDAGPHEPAKTKSPDLSGPSVDKQGDKENESRNANDDSPPSPTENGESHGHGPLKVNGLPNGGADTKDKPDVRNGKHGDAITKDVDADIAIKKQDILSRINEGKSLKEHSHVMNGLVNHLPNGDLDDLLNSSEKLRTSEKMNGVEHSVVENGFPPSPELSDKESQSQEVADKDSKPSNGPELSKNEVKNSDASSAVDAPSSTNQETNVASTTSEINNPSNTDASSSADTGKTENSKPQEEKMEVDNEQCTQSTGSVPDNSSAERAQPTSSNPSEGPQSSSEAPTNPAALTDESSMDAPDTSGKRLHTLEDTPKPKKKKSSNRANSIDSRRSSTSSLASLVLGDYVCEWANCKKSFESAKATLLHVFRVHLVGDGLCLWENCDKLHRKKLSLLTHLQERHCTEHALKGAALRRQQMGQNPSRTPTPSPAPPPPVYAHDAASQAIKRFAVKQPYQELMEPKEGPVTKHIRLTSSLILRNLARYSAHGRTIIKKHERELAYISMSTVESSGAISNCLWEIINNH